MMIEVRGLKLMNLIWQIKLLKSIAFIYLKILFMWTYKEITRGGVHVQ